MQRLEELIARVCAAEAALGQRQEAFGELVERYQVVAYQWAYRQLRERQLAQEATQEAFIVAYQKLAQLREPAAFPGWLYQIVLSQCSRLTRQRHMPTLSLELTPELPAGELDPAATLEAAELQAAVLAAVEALPVHEQVVTRLFDLRGCSLKEIAELLQLPVTTVKKRLQYARKRLRAQVLASYGVVYQSVLLLLWPCMMPAYVPCYAVARGAGGLAKGKEKSRKGGGRMGDLVERLQGELDALAAQTTLYAEHLASGQVVAVRADEPVNTLSIIKLAIMVLAYQDADAGKLALEERHTILPEELRRGSGVLQYFAPGLQPTYRDLVAQMIITSDNSATDMLIARLGRERVNEMLAARGYAVTRVQTTTGDLFRRLWERLDAANSTLSAQEVFARGFPNDAEAAERAFAFVGDPAEWLGVTTARETVRLLTQIHKGELVSRRHSDEMEKVLRAQVYSSRLPRRIDARVAVGHKTGDWGPVAGNDAGIIYSPSGPIVVALYATHNRGDYLELEATHGRVAEALLDAWG